MKKTLIILIVLISYFDSNAQIDNGEWFYSFGLNTVNSTGYLAPQNSPDEWAFSQPISWSIERGIDVDERWSIEQSFSINKFKSGKVIDGRVLDEDFSFLSTNTTAKYYITEYVTDREWLDVYAGGGLGLFVVNKANISANIGAGVIFWVDENFGIRLKSLAKFALSNKNIYDSNHFQYYLEIVIR